MGLLGYFGFWGSDLNSTQWTQHSCRACLSRRTRVIASRTAKAPAAPPRRSSILFLWLLCFPAGFCMQLNPQASIGSSVVFGTGPYEANDSCLAADSQSVWIAASAPVDDGTTAVPACQPPAMRRFCVFTHHLQQHTLVLQTAICNRGSFLSRAVCRLLSLDPQTYGLQRIVSSLPALPSEQYLLAPSDMPWMQTLVPVDLRPIGGQIRVVATDCLATCRSVFAQAAREQGFLLNPDLVCLVGTLWLMPDAQALLLPGGDALQAWTTTSLIRRAGSAPAAPVPWPDLPLSHRDELALPHQPWGSAVVIYEHGLLYLPAFDREAPHSFSHACEALSEQALTEADTVLWYFPALLPELPTHQLIALSSLRAAGLGVIDARPIGGRIALMFEPIDSEDLDLQHLADRLGEPVPGTSLSDLALTGQVTFTLSRRHSEPHADGEIRSVQLMRLQWAAPTLSRAPQLQTVPSERADFTDSTSWGQGLTPWLLVWSCLAGGIHGHASLLPVLLVATAGIPPLSRSPVALAAVESSEDTERHPSPPPQVALADPVFLEAPAHVSVASHRRVAQLLATQTVEKIPPLDIAIGSVPLSQKLCVMVWSPVETFRFSLPVDSFTKDLPHRLRRVSATHDRRMPVVVSPQFAWPCIQVVAPSKNSDLVTVLIDIGRAVLCLDARRTRSQLTC